MSKNTGFPEAVLKIIVSPKVDFHVCQLAAIFLKNLCIRSWVELSCVISQHDQEYIRKNIVNAIVVISNTTLRLLIVLVF